ncbi:hypothetical protein CR513_11469, partial [Mucuna pruriens]
MQELILEIDWVGVDANQRKGGKQIEFSIKNLACIIIFNIEVVLPHGIDKAECPMVSRAETSTMAKPGIVLNETNYDIWSQIMEMHIAKKEKLSLIRLKSPPPTKKDDEYDKCYADNQKVKRWLLMSPKIMKRYIRIATAQEIWWGIRTGGIIVETHERGILRRIPLLQTTEQTSALEATIGNFVKDIQTRQTIGCGTRRGKLYYFDLESKSSDKLRQALTVKGIRGLKTHHFSGFVQMDIRDLCLKKD